MNVITYCKECGGVNGNHLQVEQRTTYDDGSWVARSTPCSASTSSMLQQENARLRAERDEAEADVQALRDDAEEMVRLVNEVEYFRSENMRLRDKLYHTERDVAVHEAAVDGLTKDLESAWSQIDFLLEAKTVHEVCDCQLQEFFEVGSV